MSPKKQEEMYVKFFDETEGLDEHLSSMLNEKIEYLKNLYEERIEDHIKYQK